MQYGFIGMNSWPVGTRFQYKNQQVSSKTANNYIYFNLLRICNMKVATLNKGIL